jgi:hypothetical protein
MFALLIFLLCKTYLDDTVWNICVLSVLDILKTVGIYMNILNLISWSL